jgi:glutathione S-transferase
MFLGYAAVKIEYPISRYDNETRRLYRTMDTHLGKSSHGFLVGDRLTIADIACWGWVSSHSRSFPPCYPDSSGVSVN